MKALFQEIEVGMKHAVDHLHHELKAIRTGRATIALLDGVMVEYYGNMVPINQVATLSVADAGMLMAQPWEPSVIAAIERAIRKSDLGLNPANDGRVVRIPVPPLTEDRRKELVKKAHDVAEHARTAVRHARRDGNDKLKKKEKDKEISQDDERRGHDEIQKLHDHYIHEIGKALETKEKQILEH